MKETLLIPGPNRRHTKPTERILLGKTRDGFEVIDRPLSHLHVDRALVAEALSKIDAPSGDFAKIKIEMGRIVGTSICVETTDLDLVVYAKRRDRSGHSRFVFQRLPEPCSSIILVLKRIDADAFLLITAFVGAEAEPEPWDRNAGPKSRAFWKNHALIWDEREIIPGSVLTHCLSFD